jgi:hypothetical protein
MTAADQRLRAILSRGDAPADDAAFVAAVTAQTARIVPARPAGPPVLLRPFVWIAWLIALGAVAPFLAEGLNAALAASDAQVLFVSLALAASAWVAMNAFERSFRPLFAR